MSGIIGGIGAGSRSGVIGELLVGNDMAIGATGAYVPGSYAEYTGPELLLYGDQPVVHLHASGTGSPQWEMAAYNQDLRISDDGVDRLAINSTGDIYSTGWTSFSPNLTGITDTLVVGAFYMRMGSMIHVNMYITGNRHASSPSTACTITGLPFTASDSTRSHYAINIGYAVLGGVQVEDHVAGRLNADTTTVTLSYNGADNTWGVSGAQQLLASMWYAAKSW